jgi:hypothetical protein
MCSKLGGMWFYAVNLIEWLWRAKLGKWRFRRAADRFNNTWPVWKRCFGSAWAITEKRFFLL